MSVEQITADEAKRKRRLYEAQYRAKNREKLRAKALKSYYKHHERRKDAQRARAVERRKKYGRTGIAWREPQTLQERIRMLSNFDMHARRAAFHARTQTELFEAHETWLEEIDLWRIAEGDDDRAAALFIHAELS